MPPTDQRRIRHLTSISVRNLTLNPRRDHFSSLLYAAPPASSSRSQFAADDTDLYFRTRRRRATSNASLTGGTASNTAGSGSGSAGRGLPLEWLDAEREKADSVVGGVSAGVGPGPDRRALRRSLSGGAALRIDDLNEPLSPRGEEGPLATSSVDGPTLTATTASPHFPLLNSSPASSSILSAASAPFLSLRSRSTSRTSIGTAGSGSTIRPFAPPIARLPEEDDDARSFVRPDTEAGLSRSHFASEVQLAKEEARRAETLRRRLLDSFVSLRLAEREELGVTGETTAGSDRTQGKAVKNDGTGKGRLRALSTPVLPPAPQPTDRPRPPPPPFFISSPQHQTMHPTFAVDRDEFLVADPNEWTGLRKGRLIVNLWTRMARRQDVDATAKGKEKEADSVDEWRQLVEWDVELDGLVSLGKDQTSFPPLPPNSLIFRIHDEYYTAPVPSPSSASSACGSDSDEGNQSDPGAGVVLRRRTKEPAQENRRERDTMMEAEKGGNGRETRLTSPAGVEAIVRFITLQQTVDETKAAILSLKRELDQALDEPDEASHLSRERTEIQDRVDDYTSYHTELRMDLDDAKDERGLRKEALRARRGRLKAVRELDAQKSQRLRQGEKALDEDETLCASVRQTTTSRRTQLITLLSHLFPIDPSPVPSSASSFLFTIHGLALPNSAYPPSLYSEETISSALGYTAQVVSTLAAYLGVPLHYPIKCMGSRSAVVDPISMMRGPRAFPLYGKGVDRYRFDYGVFLLNKNIEQLMYWQGLKVLDLRNTLPNLKSLMLALSYDPSDSHFSSATLDVPAQFCDVPLPPASSSPTAAVDLEGRSTLGKDSSVRSVDSDDDGDAAPRSPSTIRAVSIRSLSPAPTLKEPKLANGNGHAGASASVNSDTKAFMPRLEKETAPTGKSESKGNDRGALNFGSAIA